MSKALRGDFERLRDRGVATTLAPKDDAPPEPAADDAVAAAEIEPEPLTRPEPEPTPEPGVETAPEPPVDELPVAGADEPRGGWLDRLLGR